MDRRMLAVFLNEIGHCQRRLQYCRELLASNSNFDILDIYEQIDCQALNYFKSQNLKKYLQEKSAHYKEEDFNLLFEYLDIRKDGKVSAKIFSNLFKVKTTSEKNNQKNSDAMFKVQQNHFQNKRKIFYALRRFFDQIIQNQRLIFNFEKQVENFKRIGGDEYAELTFQEIKRFMNENQRYPDQKIIECIIRGIEHLRRDLSISKIKQFIGYQSKDVLHLDQNENKKFFISENEYFNSKNEKEGKQISKKYSLNTLSIQKDHKISQSDFCSEDTFEKLVTFSQVKEEQWAENETGHSTQRGTNQTPYQQLLTPSEKKKCNTNLTPRRHQIIHKPTKIFKKTNKNPSGKENKVHQDQKTSGKKQDLEKLFKKQAGLKDVTKQISNRF